MNTIASFKDFAVTFLSASVLMVAPSRYADGGANHQVRTRTLWRTITSKEASVNGGH